MPRSLSGLRVMIGRRALRVSVGAVAAAVASSTAVAQRPAAAPAVVIYPGAEPYDPQGRPYVSRVRETVLGLPGGIPLLTATVETYLASADPLKVAAFYRARMGGVASSFAQWSAVDPRQLAPGRVSALHAEHYTEGGGTIYVHHWWAKELNGDVVLSEVRFHEWSTFDPRLADRNGPLTLITVTRKVFSTSAPDITPGEKELGAPVYPGAVYDSHASRLMLGGLEEHAFLSADPVGKVVDFYERALGRKAMQGAPVALGVNWYFRPLSAAAPDDYLRIESADGVSGPWTTFLIFSLMRIPPEEPPEN